MIDFASRYDGGLLAGLDADRCLCFANLRKLSLQGPLDVFGVLKHLDMTCVRYLNITVKASTAHMVLSSS